MNLFDRARLDRDLRRATAAYAHLGYEVPLCVQEALNDAAAEAQRLLKGEFQRRIEGGPVAYTEIRERTSRTSVDRHKGRWRQGEPEISARLAVQSKQSAYLKFLLGEEATRRPGDVGVAQAYNYIPSDVDALRVQGVTLTSQGNLPPRALKKLAAQEKKQQQAVARRAAAVAAGRRPRAGARPGGPAATAATAVPGVFFGHPNGHPTAMGWWQRNGRQRLKLLIYAAHESRYPRDYLVSAWNRSVTRAMQGVPARAVELLELVARSMPSRRASGGSGPPTTP